MVTVHVVKILYLIFTMTHVGAEGYAFIFERLCLLRDGSNVVIVLGVL